MAATKHHPTYWVKLTITISGHHRHHRRTRTYLLRPNQKEHIMSNVSVGHVINYTWNFIDANGD